MTREEYIKNQEEYAKSIHAPCFLPPDGRCYSCGHDIAQDGIDHGGNGKTGLITACYHCNTSFCE